MKFLLALLVVGHIMFIVPRIHEWNKVAGENEATSSWRVRNLDKVAELLRKTTPEDGVILSMWPGYAYESRRKVLDRWEMGVFNHTFLPYFSLDEAKHYHMAYQYNLPKLVKEHAIDAIVCGIDTRRIDRRFLRSLKLPRYVIGDTEVFLVPDSRETFDAE